MYCSKCGEQLRPNASFCHVCGTKTFDKSVTQCDTSNPPAPTKEKISTTTSKFANIHFLIPKIGEYNVSYKTKKFGHFLSGYITLLLTDNGVGGFVTSSVSLDEFKRSAGMTMFAQGGALFGALGGLISGISKKPIIDDQDKIQKICDKIPSIDELSNGQKSFWINKDEVKLVGFKRQLLNESITLVLVDRSDKILANFSIPFEAAERVKEWAKEVGVDLPSK